MYIGNVCGFGAMTCPDADWTLKLNTGEKNPELGVSYIQFAMQGLRHQMSQGAANWTIDPGDRFTFYRLVDSVVPSTVGKDGHEKSFFDGIDTTWAGLAAGGDEKALPKLGQQFNEIAKLVSEASNAAKGSDISMAAAPLTKLVAELNGVSAEVQASPLSPSAKLDLSTRVVEKRQQAETALNLALGVTLTANASSNGEPDAQMPKEPDALTTVSPGQEFGVAVTFHNGSKQALLIDHVKLEVPEGWTTIEGKTKAEMLKAGR